MSKSGSQHVSLHELQEVNAVLHRLLQISDLHVVHHPYTGNCNRSWHH